MDNYLLLKLIHILSAVVMAGTGAGLAFFMLMAAISKNTQGLLVVTRLVIWGDWLFTLPAVIVQIVTGLLLMQALGWGMTSIWMQWVLGLYLLIGLCWLPVLVIQYKLQNEVKATLLGKPLGCAFNRLMALWCLLGMIAFSAVLILFWLMVYKPFPVI